MSELRMDRRQAVRTAAGVAAGGVLVAGAGVGSAAAHDSSNALLGSWLVTHRDNPPGPPNVGRTVVSVIAGGVIIGNDIDPPGPVSSGSWSYRGNGRFVATLWAGFPAEGTNPAGTYRLQVSGRLRDRKVSGTFTVTVFPKGGKPFRAATGTFEGRKIPAS